MPRKENKKSLQYIYVYTVWAEHRVP